MNTSKLLTLVVLFIFLLIAGSTNRLSKADSRTEQGRTIKEEEKTALAVVQEYLDDSSEGKFDQLADLTTTKPKRFREAVDVKELAKQYPRGTALVIPNEKVWEKSDLRHLRQEFPQVIRDTGHRIVIVAGLWVKDDLAKISVNLGNDDRYQALPMVFVLTRETPAGKWKIFDITTPAYAAGYK